MINFKRLKSKSDIKAFHLVGMIKALVVNLEASLFGIVRGNDFDNMEIEAYKELSVQKLEKVR